MRPATISTQAWDQIFSNFIAQTGTTWGNYVTMLDNNASYLGRLGEQVTDVGQLLSFEVQQADGLTPVPTLAASLDASVDAPGLALTFSVSFRSPSHSAMARGPWATTGLTTGNIPSPPGATAPWRSPVPRIP